MRTKEVEIRNPQVYQWAFECLRDGQILNAGGYPHKVVMAWFTGRIGFYVTQEVARNDS